MTFVPESSKTLSPIQMNWLDMVKFPYLIHLFNLFFAAKSSAYMQAIEQMAFYSTWP